MRVIACIPSCNEEKNIAKVIVHALKYVDQVFVIDDGSLNSTALISEKLGAKVFRHDQQRGYGGAIKSCFQIARMLDPDVMVIIDADGQHNADEIPNVISPVLSYKADISVGVRDLKDAPGYRKTGINVITKISGAGISDAQSGFRAYSRKAFSSFSLQDENWGVSLEILKKAIELGLKIAEVPITCRYEKSSRTHPIKQGMALVESVFYQTIIRRPLAYVLTPGLAFVVVGLIAFIELVSLYVSLHQFIISWGILFVSSTIIGLLLCFLGIILYTIRKRFG